MGLKTWLWLRALAVLTEDPGTILSTHIISVPEDPTPSSDLLRHCTYVMHIHICRKTPPHSGGGGGTGAGGAPKTVSLYRPGCPVTHYIDQGSFEL